MSIGEKIRKFRIKKHLSQKKLASLSNISEPAVRNYELGNRTPSDKQIAKIADALHISPYAISEPNLDDMDGIMYALFYLHETVGLQPVIIDGKASLVFDEINQASTILNREVTQWAKCKLFLSNGYISEEYYNEWLNTYPEKLNTEEYLNIYRKYNKDNNNDNLED